MKPGWQPLDGQVAPIGNAGTAEDEVAPLGKARYLEDQCRGAIGILLTARREGGERWTAWCVGDKRKTCRFRLASNRRANMETQIGGSGNGQIVQPERRVAIG